MKEYTPARTIFAIFLGYLAFLLLEVIGAFVTAGPLHATGTGSLLVSGEAVTLLSAIVAGALAARVAKVRPLAHAGALGLSMFSVTIVVAIVSPRSPHAIYPAWFPYATACLAGAGSFVGGALATLSKPQAG